MTGKYGDYENERLDRYKDSALSIVDLAYQAGANDKAEELKDVSAATDAVVEAAHKATCAWPGSGAFTMPALNKALAKLEKVKE